jgi:hypothetical protein
LLNLQKSGGCIYSREQQLLPLYNIATVVILVAKKILYFLKIDG